MGATALKTNIESMKLFVVLSLASVAIGGMDYEMTQKWQKLKAMESCWGEENMKLVMVDMKKAIAKCSHEDDAPDEEEPQQLLPIQCNEQQLPPRRLQDGHNEDDDADDEDEEHDEER